MPRELWSALDPQTIATENGAAAALLNGPRYWLMNHIEKERKGPQITKNFGGIDMLLQATVLLSSMNPTPYSVNQVTRHTVFVFGAGQEIYELQDPHGPAGSCRPGARSWTPTCRERICADSAIGSTFRRAGPTTPACSPKRCASTPPSHAAQVPQDDLANSYSLVD